MEPTTVPRRSALGTGSRYELLVKIATGGTATVYVGRLRSSEGFSRLVAIKRAHPHLRDDPQARRMLVREATLASRIHHANVVPIQDVEQSDDELLLVMSYVEGGTLAELLEATSADGAEPLAPAVALRILLDASAGLAAVHELRDDHGRVLGLVHRDVSPQNVLVGVDGTSRLTDFGLAKVTEVSASSTATMQGKVAYLAPEYVEGRDYTQACDLFSLGVVAWETLSGRRLFKGNSDADTLRRVVGEEAPALSAVCAGYGEALDALLAKVLDKDPVRRPPSAAALTRAIAEAARPLVPATHLEVGEAVRRSLKGALARRREVIRAAANPAQADTVSVLHDDLPVPPRLDEPVTAVATEPTAPLDPALFGDEDDPDGLLDAETHKLPAARVDEEDGLEGSESRRFGRPAMLALAALGGAALVVVWLRSPDATPLVSDLGALAAGVVVEAGAVSSQATAPPTEAPARSAASSAERTPPAPRRPPPIAKPRPAAPKPTSKPLPSNPYKPDPP